MSPVETSRGAAVYVLRGVGGYGIVYSVQPPCTKYYILVDMNAML